MSHLFAAGFDRALAQKPDSILLREGDVALTFATFDQQARRMARALLARNLPRGAVVGAVQQAAVAQSLVFVACQYAGLVFAPMNTSLTASELKPLLARIGVAVMVVAPKFMPMVMQLGCAEVLTLDDAGQGAWLDGGGDAELPLDLCDDLPCLVIASSGSMGVPKCVEITRGGYRRQILCQGDEAGVREADVVQLVLPLYHAGGLIGVLGMSFARGARVEARLGAFRAAEAIAHIRERNVTITHWIPTMISRVVEYLSRENIAVPPSLRAIHFGSMMLPDALRKAGLSLFPGLMWQSYGSTECGYIGCLTPQELASGHGYTVRLRGKDAARIIDPQGRDVAPGDVGEVVMAQAQASFGRYIGDPERTAKTRHDGFVHSGDLARNEGDGFITILGRGDAVILTGGLKVYPCEVEESLMAHLPVAEVAVIGVPDAEFGERICAVIVADDRHGLTLTQIQDGLRPYLAGYKMPRQVRLLDQLPRTGSGKVAYGELRRQFVASQAVLD